MAHLTFRQYAQHRGVSPEAVSRAVKEGRITTVLDQAGRRWIDPARADAEWAANTDAAKAVGGNTPKQRPSTGGPALGGEKTFEHGAGPAAEAPSMTYAKSRARREAFMARLARLDYEERTGKLVPIDKVKVDAFRCARAARDSILAVPERLAAELAGLSDPAAVHKRLEEELTRALEAVANAVAS